ncbi:TPA: hypothetical protein JAN03_16405 [Citrobacter freundii]|nr:hypothetical protein [Citrobacter freundii]
MADKFTLTETQWKMLQPLLCDMHQMRLSIAYDVLVRKRKHSDVARIYDVNGQYVHHSVAAVRRIFIEREGPLHFVSGWLPESAARRVINEIKKFERYRAEKKLRQK